MQSWIRRTECIFCLSRRLTRTARLQGQPRTIPSRSLATTNDLRHRESGTRPARNAKGHGAYKTRTFDGGLEQDGLLDQIHFVGRVEESLRRLEYNARPDARGAHAWSACATQLDPDGSRWQDFRAQITSMMEAYQANDSSSASKSRRPGLVEDLRSESRQELWRVALNRRLKFAFIDFVLHSEKSVDPGTDATAIDLRYPTEWYPETRCLQRNIHLHVGPTNSGKTYNALKRLENAKSGFYAGPLRLLAHEVYSRFNNRGNKCDLITGDDVRLNAEKVETYCSTVEMIDVSTNVDVGVVDEIQMIASQERGWAWTRAVLGARAAELHLCGEARVVPLIRELVASMGDTLHIHQYERLNPLKVMSRSLRGNLKNLRKGDCLVSFSVVNIHALKKQIEIETGKRVAIVYGSLPPETRAQQAALFNDPDNDFDFLVASDAIGMGLNLSIKRIVFETTMRFNGTFLERLSISDIKQIGGRAGRYRTASDDKKVDAEKPQGKTSNSIGLVTCLGDDDLPFIQKAMKKEAPPIKAAGLLPPGEAYEEVASRFPPGVPFEYTMQHINRIVSLNPRFSLCNMEDQLAIARALDHIPNLTVQQRLLFCASPASLRGRGHRHDHIIVALAQVVSERRVVTIADIPEIPLEVLNEPISWMRHYLERLEILHKALILYLWLSYRFTQFLGDRDMAVKAKEMTEERINTCLTQHSANPLLRKRLKRMREAADQSEGIKTVDQDDHDPDTDADADVDTSVTMNPDLSVEEVERQARIEKFQRSVNNEPDMISDFINDYDDLLTGDVDGLGNHDNAKTSKHTQ